MGNCTVLGHGPFCTCKFFRAIGNIFEAQRFFQLLNEAEKRAAMGAPLVWDEIDEEQGEDANIVVSELSVGMGTEDSAGAVMRVVIDVTKEWPQHRIRRYKGMRAVNGDWFIGGTHPQNYQYSCYVPSYRVNFPNLAKKGNQCLTLESCCYLCIEIQKMKDVFERR